MDDREFVLQVEKQYREMSRDPETMHNKELHRQILRTWERDSPKMWANLTRLGVASKMAFVCQEQMWRQKALLLRAGMAVTDAQEQAEKDNLMLEPETPEIQEDEEP